MLLAYATGNVQRLMEVNRNNRHGSDGVWTWKYEKNWNRQQYHMILFGRSIFVVANNTGVKTLASRLVTRFAEGILGVGHMTTAC